MLHVIIKTCLTADGKRVEIWNDGLVTSGLGGRIPGIGASRDAKVKAADLRAALWFAGDALLFDFDELGVAIAAARRCARRDPSALPGHFRAAATNALKARGELDADAGAVVDAIDGGKGGV